MKKTQMSGTSNIKQLPKLLSCPSLLQLNSANLLMHRMVYVIRHYGNVGISILITRRDDEIVVLCGDWNGNSIDLSVENGKYVNICMDFLKSDLNLLIKTMCLIKLKQAQYFFAINDDKLILVDIQISMNKLTSPGMLSDIFSKVIKTQEVIVIETLDDRSLECITNGVGSYGGDLILKPSKFSTCSTDSGDTPLYIEVRR